jgi:hypothetical protein
MLTDKFPAFSLPSADAPVETILENANHWRRLALRLAHHGERERQSHNMNLLYGGVAAGVLIGTVISLYWWKTHARASNLQDETPFERVEDLIASCETKIEDLEQAITALKATK